MQDPEINHLTTKCPLFSVDQVGVAVDASASSFLTPVTYILWSGVGAWTCCGFTSAVIAVDEIVVWVDTTFGSELILLCEMELLNLFFSWALWMLTRFFLWVKGSEKNFCYGQFSNLMKDFLDYLSLFKYFSIRICRRNLNFETF